MPTLYPQVDPEVFGEPKMPDPILPCLECGGDAVGRTVQGDNRLISVYRLRCSACTPKPTSAVTPDDQMIAAPPIAVQRRYDGPKPRSGMPAGKPISDAVLKWCRSCRRNISREQFRQKQGVGRSRGRHPFCQECERQQKLENS